MNIFIKESFNGKKDVKLCDNGNLFHRGQPAFNVLNKDGVRLTKFGMGKLEANIKNSISSALNCPLLNLPKETSE